MRLALYVCLKNICDGVRGQDESNGIPLYPPLFWLDNIFKAEVEKIREVSGTKLRNISFKKSGKSHLAMCMYCISRRVSDAGMGVYSYLLGESVHKGVTVSLHPATPFKKEVQ